MQGLSACTPPTLLIGATHSASSPSSGLYARCLTKQLSTTYLCGDMGGGHALMMCIHTNEACEYTTWEVGRHGGMGRHARNLGMDVGTCWGMGGVGRGLRKGIRGLAGPVGWTHSLYEGLYTRGGYQGIHEIIIKTCAAAGS